MKLWPNVILGTRDESLRTSSGEANVHTTRDEFSWLKNWTRLFVHKEPLNSFALFNFNFFIGFSFFSTELLHKPIPTFGASCAYREQQQRRRLQKRHLKSEVALPQTLSRLFHLVQFVKCWQFFLELNSKILHQSSGKKKKKLVVLCSRLPQNVKLGSFTSTSYSDGKENVYKNVWCTCRVVVLPN